MAYTIQVYKFHTMKSPKDILYKIKHHAENAVDAEEIRVGDVKLSNRDSLVTGSLSVMHSTGTHICEFTMKPSINLLVLHCPSILRPKVSNFLARVVEDGKGVEVVIEHNVTVDQMLTIFDKINKEDVANIIEILRVYFEPELGHKYAKEMYTEFQYKFIRNRCASKHRDFKELCKNGKRMDMTFVVHRCTGITDSSSSPTVKLVAKSNCSFRMYRDVPREDWVKFCMEILGFLIEI